eukprot:13083478-Ditylum_brightwellii.AAC.1
MGGDLVSIHSKDENDYVRNEYSSGWVGWSRRENTPCGQNPQTYCDGSFKDFNVEAGMADNDCFHFPDSLN